MVREEKRTGIVFGFYAIECCLEIGELRRPDRRIGNDAGVFERITVHRQNSHERRVEGEEDPRLNLCRPGKPAGFGGDDERLGAKIAQVRVEALRMRERREHPVVVAGGGQDRGRIIAIWFVELIVVILRFAETVHDIAEQKRKLRHFFGVGFLKVARKFIGNGVLRFRTDRASAIAERVKHDLPRRRDFLRGGGRGPEDFREGQLRFRSAARRRKR